MGHVSWIGGSKNVTRVLVRECEGNRPLGGPRYRQDDDIKTDVHAIKLALSGFIWLRIRVSGRLL